MSQFLEKHFLDPEAARKHLEAIRWPDGPVCPHCGGVGKIHKVSGKKHRPGLYACRDCNGHFTVTVGTVFERSHIPLHKWFQAVYLLCSSKKGMSSHQLHRTLGVTYKTAWFMSHRIREAMKTKNTFAVGGGGKAVEVDETFIGMKADRQKMGGASHLRAVVSLVERGGEVRSFHVERANAKNVRSVMVRNISPKSKIMTDEASYYRWVRREFADHQSVNHSAEEWVRGEAHTNTLEGFFSIFKRGMKGVYQHCGEQHLKRYLVEFDFRYNTRTRMGFTDVDRTIAALKGIEGRRLTYGGPRRSSA
jgi:transposase-like protein